MDLSYIVTGEIRGKIKIACEKQRGKRSIVY